MTDISAPSNRRWVWLACFLTVAGLLGYGYYLQFVEYLDPCPLCITQRLFYYGIGIISVIALFGLRKPLWQRICAGLLSLSAVGGITAAGRQVWLQHLPPEMVPECGPGLQYWLENEPLLKTLSLLFKGDGNCAEVHWRFLGLSIGEWSLALFVSFLVIGLLMLFSQRSADQHSIASATG